MVNPGPQFLAELVNDPFSGESLLLSSISLLQRPNDTRNSSIYGRIRNG
ncbi:MAG: hypothetical protein MI923_29175 [Phycisphaerales bacterium]|nr:hypothetical protein [Phycisphaerales bacterium]